VRIHQVQQQQGNSDPSSIASYLLEGLPRVWNYISNASIDALNQQLRHVFIASLRDWIY